MFLWIRAQAMSKRCLIEKKTINVTQITISTLSCRLILSIKKLQQLSLVSMSPNPLSSIRMEFTTMSMSSSLNRSGMSPGGGPRARQFTQAV